MSSSVTVSAPGKLVVMGDHAVVYGYPAIVTAVGQRLRVTAELRDEPVLELDAPDVGIEAYRKPMLKLGSGPVDKGARVIEFALRRLRDDGILKTGVSVKTSCEFSAQFGFGSSGASAVCVIAAVLQLVQGRIARRKVFDLAYQSVKDSGSSGSGIDLAASVFGGLVYFVTGGKVIEPLKVGSMPFVIGYTGVKVDTGTIVAEVKERAKQYPKVIGAIFTSIAALVNDGREAAKKGDLRTFGEMMNFNQGFLEALGVSSAKLAAMIYAAREAGALGAKLSGAGKGDCMLALCDSDQPFDSAQGKRQAVSDNITKAGGQVIDIPCNADGLKLES